MKHYVQILITALSLGLISPTIAGDISISGSKDVIVVSVPPNTAMQVHFDPDPKGFYQGSRYTLTVASDDDEMSFVAQGMDGSVAPGDGNFYCSETGNTAFIKTAAAVLGDFGPGDVINVGRMQNSKTCNYVCLLRKGRCVIQAKN